MTINCLGQLIGLEVPRVMGILNITPDSFYEGSRFKDTSSILQTTETMLENGATFIDIGAYSSRPGADHVEEEEELARLTPVVDLLLKEFPDLLLSVDTFRSKVAAYCLDSGAAIINDITGGDAEPEILQVTAGHKAPFIAMHMRGTPQTMATQTQYEDLLTEICSDLSKKIRTANAQGLNDLILDPGFGFAKTREQNFEILRSMERLQLLERPVLVGISRKSMIYKSLNTTATEALNGTTALHMVALQKGARILRVHDVKEAVECVKLYGELHAH